MANRASSIARAHGEIQMTDGSLWKNMFYFSIPLMLSQLLQVLFNMADVAVVGKFSSAEALGAVGSTTTLVTLFTGFLIGMGSAVNVRVAQHLGARDKASTAASIRTSFVICLATGGIIMVLCLLSARFMLELLGTKDDLIEGAVLYFRIYALGMPALGAFNFGNGVLSANGDTKRPLTYLTIAGILNVLFNLLFVIVCGMVEDGVALASIITQYVSAALILMHMGRQEDDCAFRLGDLKTDRTRPRGNASSGLGSRQVFKMPFLLLPTCLYKALSTPLMLSWSRGIPPQPMPMPSSTMLWRHFIRLARPLWGRIWAPESAIAC